MVNVSLLWFRLDLRLEDNPAFAFALEQGFAVLPVYIHDPEPEGSWSAGGASRWWLHHALADLATQLEGRGLRLILREGESVAVLEELIEACGVETVLWNRCYEPRLCARDASIKTCLREKGLTARSFNAGLLREGGEVLKQDGTPYKVFTPYWKAAKRLPMRPLAVARSGSVSAPESWPESRPLESLSFLPKVDWAAGFRSRWEPTRAGAIKALDRFKQEALGGYSQGRDFPGEAGTSSLSPYLHCGQLGVREVLDALPESGAGAASYERQLYWRDFAYYLLWHYPKTPEQPLDADFEHFPWRQDEDGLCAWQQGRTGFPIVDAGLRELWATGWMHNRVRMIVASFLVKDLVLDWRQGADWFWDTLVDADLACNTLGWQWAGGCGADAAPYFRVFNPSLQGQKFDAEGHYVKQWCPELSDVPKKWIHSPWAAPSELLAKAGVQLGSNYPKPVVDHAEARKRALALWDKFKALRR